MVAPLPHTSEFSCDGPLVMVGEEGDVVVSVGGLPVDTRAKSGIAPGHIDIKGMPACFPSNAQWP